MKKAVKALSAAAGGLAGYVAVTAAVYMPFVINDARKDFHDGCEYLMILGGDITGEDTPSPQLAERMRAAAEYLKENPDVIAVPCGGCFRPAQKKSEAGIIADYLTSHGIDGKRIILEDKSTTTIQNFRFALPLIKWHSGKEIEDVKIAFLSSTYHMHRASVIAKKCGIKQVLRVSCPTPGEAAQRFVREYFVGYTLLTLK